MTFDEMAREVDQNPPRSMRAARRAIPQENPKLKRPGLKKLKPGEKQSAMDRILRGLMGK